MDWLTTLLGGLGAGLGGSPAAAGGLAAGGLSTALGAPAATAPMSIAPPGTASAGATPVGAINGTGTPAPDLQKALQGLGAARGLMNGMNQSKTQPTLLPMASPAPIAHPQPIQQPMLLGSIQAPPFNPVSPRYKQ